MYVLSRLALKQNYEVSNYYSPHCADQESET